MSCYKVYIDESGTHAGSRAMVLAGYVFKPIEAVRFTRDWSHELRSFGIPFAHQTDCATGNGVYAKMEMSKRIKIQTRLIELTRKRSLFGFSVVSDPVWLANDMAQAPSPVKESSLYTMLAVTCMHIINDWADKNRYAGSFSYTFEAGHASQSEANRVMNGCANEPARRRARYSSHSFQDKSESQRLQSADMLAWQTYHYWSQRLKSGKTAPRADFRALTRSQDIITLFPPSSFPPAYGPPNPSSALYWTD